MLITPFSSVLLHSPADTPRLDGATNTEFHIPTATGDANDQPIPVAQIIPDEDPERRGSVDDLDGGGNDGNGEGIGGEDEIMVTRTRMMNRHPTSYIKPVVHGLQSLNKRMYMVSRSSTPGTRPTGSPYFTLKNGQISPTAIYDVDLFAWDLGAL
jgi:hypothetical protein